MKTKTKTRVLSLLLTLAMLLTSFVVVIPASADGPDATPWHLSNDVATAFAGGSGTPEDPYQIATAGQLAYLAKIVNAGERDSTNEDKAYSTLAYKVTTNIDATAHQWTAIGTSAGSQFVGTFDGGNFTISTVLNDITNEFYTTSALHGGLFGRIGGNAVVKNIKLDFTYAYDKRPTTSNNWFGFLSCAIYNSATVDNCHVTMHVTGTATGSKAPTGAITGYLKPESTSKALTVSNCSVNGTLDVNSPSSGTPMAFASFFGAISGAANTTAHIENCITTADITLKTCGHQDFLGGLAVQIWGGATGTIEVTNFVDVSKITTTTATCYLHYGTLASSSNSANTLVFKVNGLVAGQTFQGLISNPGSSGGKECVSNLISGSRITNATETPMTFDNVYTTNPMLPEFYTHEGTITLPNEVTVTGTNVVHDKDLVKTATFAYEVDEEEGTIAITVPAGLYDIYDAVGVAAVGYGSKTTSEYTNNGNGTYTFVIKTTERGAGYITVDQAITVQDGEDNLGNPVYKEVKTGFTATHNDMWKTYAEKITFSNSSGSPTTITTAEQFAYLSYYYNTIMGGTAPNNKNIYIKLGNDIDLSHRNWVAVGQYNLTSMQNKDFRFKGTLDGNNCTINGLTITDRAHADDEPAALFGGTASPTQITDLFMTNVYINVTVGLCNNGTGAAAVVNFASGSTALTNVHVDGTVYATIIASEARVGGLDSWGNNVNLTNCSMSGAVTVKSSADGIIPVAGGIIGYNGGYGTATSCVNYATVTVIAWTSNSIAGGIMGAQNGNIGTTATDSNANDYKIINCVNAGDIVVANYNSSHKANNMRLGGIVGAPGRGGKTGSLLITGCVNLGQIDCSAPAFKTGGASGVGQIAGYNEIVPHGSANVTDQPKGLVIENCFGLPSATENNVMVTSQSTYNESELWINGGKNTTGNVHMLLEDAGNTMLFEIDTDGKTVTVSKKALDILLNAGFAMTLTYGKRVYNNPNNANVVGDNYVWTMDEDAGVDATLTLQLLVGTNSKPVTVSARKATWAGMFAANTFASDDPATDAIEIANAAELGYLAKLMNSAATYASVQTASFILTKDIDLSGAEWTPIAPTHVGTYAFKGIFEGDNNKILNMTLTAESYAYNQAFIARAEGNFAMQNVTFVNPVIKAAGSPLANQTVPAVVTAVGSLYGGTITNVYVTGLDLYVANAHSDAYIGGLVGYLGNPDATVTNCSAAGKIVVFATENTALKVGGVVSRSKYGKVLNSSSAVDIAVTTDGNTQGTNVGGIIGQVNGDEQSHTTEVTNVANSGSITVTHTAIESQALLSVGGIIGRMMKGTLEVTKAFNGGKIEVTSANQAVINKAAIVGYIDNKNVTTTVSGASDITGLVAMNGAVVEDATAYNGELELTTLDGARVRIAPDALENSGIRFDSYISADVVKALKDKGYTVTFGTLIAKAKTLADANGNWDALVDMGNEPGSTKKAVVYDVALVNGGNYNFHGALRNIQEKNYNVEFTAVAYMTITIADGVTVTIYGDTTTTRSIAYVAQCALDDPKANYSDEQIEILEIYAAANQ